MQRNTILRVCDALEDLMIETGKGTMEADRAVWWACKPLWELLQSLLRKWKG